MQRYRDDMTDAEKQELLAECEQLDAAYAAADQAAAANAAACGDVSDEERDAVAEQSLDYFNRFIAGDRK